METRRQKRFKGPWIPPESNIGSAGDLLMSCTRSKIWVNYARSPEKCLRISSLNEKNQALRISRFLNNLFLIPSAHSCCDDMFPCCDVLSFPVNQAPRNIRSQQTVAFSLRKVRRVFHIEQIQVMFNEFAERCELFDLLP